LHQDIKVLPEFSDHHSLDGRMITADPLREPHRLDNGSTPHAKESIMRAHGHTTVWGTHLGIGHGTEAQSWYQQLRDWWAAYTAARREANLAALRARWDAMREAVTPCRADAAPEMAAAQHALSVATVIYCLSQ
jgi:hypothetical protein